MSAAGPFPVRPDPVPGEHLQSFAARVEHFNLLRNGSVADQGVGLKWRAADRGAVDRLASAVELDAWTVWGSTLDAYPRSVTGRKGSVRTHTRTWRLPGVRWVCPSCTPVSGVWLRDWQLACHPLCIACGVVLIDPNPRGPGAEVIACDDRAVRTQQSIARVLALLAAGNTSSPGRLRALYTATTLVSLTADESWPRPRTFEADLRAHIARTGLGVYRQWDRRPPVEPAQAAAVVLPTWRSLQADPVRLVAEGWARLKDHGGYDRILDEPPRWLPRRPPVIHLPRARGPHAGRNLEAQVRAGLEWLHLRHGLAPRHVPGMLVTAQERFLPPAGDVTGRRHLAVVLLWLLRRAVHRSGVRPGELGHIEGNLPLTFLREGRGLTTENADLLTTMAIGLVTDGLVDYHARRQELGAVLFDRSELDHALARIPGLPAPGRSLAWHRKVLRAWVFTDVARQPPGPAPLLAATRDFDACLDPWVRLQLRTAALDALDLSWVEQTASSSECAPSAAGHGRLADDEAVGWEEP